MADRSMPLMGHLAELRRRLFICAIALALGTAVSFVYRQLLFELLQITGVIGPTMKVSLVSGCMLALPVIVFQTIMFLSPGLTGKERRFLLLMLPGVVLFFLMGASFAYFVLVPAVISFLLEFGREIATPIVSVGSYVNTVLGLIFWMGIGFELPFLMYVVARLGIARPGFFSRQRRAWVVIAVVLGAVITPTFDPVNQMIVAVPFIVLYEIGIWLSKLATRRAKQSSAASAAPDASPS
ncbi:MAG: tatC [Dehalococcoidia bacterium]|nr:tatC [Dehalococcoidia bacterium]